MSITIDELLAKLQSGGIQVSSEYRNEDAQRGSSIQRIPTVKKASGKKAQLLMITEIALPFNPMTGEEDETVNRNNKYRPTMSCNTAMLLYKRLANEVPRTKEQFVARIGKTVDEWDTTNTEEINDLDREIFNKHRYPVVFTVPVINIGIKSVTGNDFGRNYRLDVEKDPISGAVIGEKPVPLQLYDLQTDLGREQANEIEEKVKNGELDLNEKDLKEAKSKCYKRHVSQDKPANFYLAIELPKDARGDFEESVKLGSITAEDLFSLLRLVKPTTNLYNCMDEFLTGAKHRVDFYNNFWEVEMNCPKEDDSMKLGKDTSFSHTINPVKELDGLAKFNEVLSTYLDDTADENGKSELEKMFLASSYISSYNEDVEYNLLDAMSSLIDLESPYMTTRVVERNSKIIEMIFGDEGVDKVMEADAGMLKEGTIDDTSDLKDLDIASMVNNQALVLEDEIE